MLAVRAGDTCVNFSNSGSGSSGACTTTPWTSVDTTGSNTTGSGNFTSVLTGEVGELTYKVYLTTTYIKPNNFFTQDYKVEIPEGNEEDVRLYYGLDSYLAGGDKGPGYYLPTPQEVGVNKEGQKMAFRYSAGPNWTSYLSTNYSRVFGSPGPAGGSDYNNEINESPSTDNGFGTSWNLGSASGLSPRISNFFAFSSPGVPSAPDSPTVALGDNPGEVDVTWNATEDTTDYIVTSSPGSGTCTVSAPETTCTAEDLPDGVYRFNVTPRNISGPGFPSQLSEPILVGDVPQHQFRYDANGATSGSVPADPTQLHEGWPTNVRDNTGGLERAGYTFAGWNVRAAGNGVTYAPGSEFEMPDEDVTLYAKWEALPVPSEPPAPSATALDDRNVRIRFTPPASGPTPTHYTATSQPGGKTCTVPATADPLECVVSGLQPDTKYTFTATADNEGGSSVPSPESNEVTTPKAEPKPGPTAKPAKPAKVKVAGNAFSKTKRVSWAKGPVTGARAVEHYRIKLNVDRCPTVILNKKLSKNTTRYTFKRSWLLKRKNSTCVRTRGEVGSNRVRYLVRIEAVNSRGVATTVKRFTIQRKR